MSSSYVGTEIMGVGGVEDDAEQSRRANWFKDNIEIVRKKREALKQSLKKIADRESYLADEAYSLFASGKYESIGKENDESFLKFLIDTARDIQNESNRIERGRNHFA